MCSWIYAALWSSAESSISLATGFSISPLLLNSVFLVVSLSHFSSSLRLSQSVLPGYGQLLLSTADLSYQKLFHYYKTKGRSLGDRHWLCGLMFLWLYLPISGRIKKNSICVHNSYSGPHRTKLSFGRPQTSPLYITVITQMIPILQLTPRTRLSQSLYELRTTCTLI